MPPCGAISVCNSSQVATNALAGNNPVAVVASPAVAKIIVSQNPDRAEILIQNVGTTIILIGLGFAPDALNYSLALKAGTLANDGTGGVYASIVWKGAIYAVATGGAGVAAITEEI